MEEEKLDQTWRELLPPVSQPVSPASRFWPTEQEGIEKKTLAAGVVNFLKLVFAFLGTAIFVYFFLTAPTYWARASYKFSHWGKKEAPTILITQKQANKVITLAEIKNPPPLPTASPQTTPSPSTQTSGAFTLRDLENNTLIIPKIDQKIPIIWNSPPDEETMLKNLQKGVVHYNGTALPGEGKGPIFITGHSSYYWWDKGAYKTVFANLDRLQEGDEVALAYQDIVYVYRVFEKIVVRPEQVEVLNPVNEPILDLMTCVPVGTNLKRLIVKAKQISPTESLEETKKEPQPQPLPTLLDSSETSDLLPSP